MCTDRTGAGWVGWMQREEGSGVKTGALERQKELEGGG